MKTLAIIGFTLLSFFVLFCGIYFLCSQINNNEHGSRLKEILICSLFGWLIGYISARIFNYIFE